MSIISETVVNMKSRISRVITMKASHYWADEGWLERECSALSCLGLTAPACVRTGGALVVSWGEVLSHSVYPTVGSGCIYHSRKCWVQLSHTGFCVGGCPIVGNFLVQLSHSRKCWVQFCHSG